MFYVEKVLYSHLVEKSWVFWVMKNIKISVEYSFFFSEVWCINACNVLQLHFDVCLFFSIP